MSFASTFKYLSDVYVEAILTKDFTAPLSTGKTCQSLLQPIPLTSAVPITNPCSIPPVLFPLFYDSIESLSSGEQDELEENAEWLCSVANDCRRVTEDAMITKLIEQSTGHGQVRVGGVDGEC